MDVAMTAPTAAAAIATIIIEGKDRPLMMLSSPLPLKLLQWIFFDAHEIRGDVFRCRVRTFSFRKVEFLRAQSVHQPRKTIVSFVAARLVIDSVLLLALLGEFLADGPWPGPHRWILDGDR